jgi:hypothetical protein
MNTKAESKSKTMQFQVSAKSDHDDVSRGANAVQPPLAFLDATFLSSLFTPLADRILTAEAPNPNRRSRNTSA